MSELLSIKKLLHDGLDIARERVIRDGGFTPFGIALSGDSYQVVEDMKNDGLEDVVYALREKAQDGDVEAILCCMDGLMVPPGETAKVDAIQIILESKEQCIKGYQLYGKNLDGDFVFAPLEAEEADALVFD